MLTKIRDLNRKVVYKIARFLGEESVAPESLQEIADANETMSLNEAIFERLLPYEAMLDNDLFMNKTTMGFGLYLAPGSGADAHLVKAHAELLKHRLPEGFDLTVMMHKHHYLENDLIRGFKAILERGGMYEAIARMSIRYHLNAIKSGYKNKRNIPAQLADYRCYLFVSTKKSKESQQSLEDSRLDFESELSVMGYHHARLSRTDFKTLLRVLTSPNIDDIQWPTCEDNTNELLSKGMIRPNTTVLINDDSVDIRVVDDEGHPKTTRLVSLMIEKNKWPKKFALWSQADLFANLFSTEKGIQCPFLISFTIKGVNQEQVRQESKRKTESLTKANNAVQRALNPNLVDELKNWQYCYDEAHKGNLSLHRTFYNVLLFTDVQHERKHVAQTLNAYREFGFSLVQKPVSAWLRYLGSLPFFLNEGMFESLERMDDETKRLSHYTCANLMPLIADFKGSPKGMLLPTYRHQLAYVDTFDSKNLPISNFNFVTVGSSGSGKSLLNQWRLLSGLAQGEKIFVIDLGDSYKHLCELVGGTYLNAANITLNPFTLFDFDGEVEIDGKVTNNYTQIRDLLAIMASPHAPISSIQSDYLLEAVRACWQQNGAKTCMDDVLQALRLMLQNLESKDDVRLSDLIIHLRKFGRDGLYGSMFNSDTPFISNPDFVVLEMGGFEENPELLTIIMFVMIVIIQGQFYHSDRNVRKLCIIDEAWRFISEGSTSNPIAARFISQGFRTARKYNGGFGVIFQELTAMTGSIEGQAVASSSDIKFIMRQGTFEDYVKNNPDVYDEKQKRLIKSFGEAESQGFSSVMVQYGKAYTFHRYFADPFTRVLFSSNAEEFAAIETFRSQGLSLEQAVYRVAEQYYGDELCKVS
ncbi:type IV secretion system protein TraC [Legionella drozanskii]|uniref:F pilus assembly protein TraC n=1 Tax=Legionella drozanskii LLAP-1 TaxID=1212489 RepID=A0A0W0SM58_9GAMM|nr:type IV secretion system protein TraC [Legionella drozanskii]KTC84398.1 F pilus assembly protein TraC [Legionella drozanskii LLAP-1]